LSGCIECKPFAIDYFTLSNNICVANNCPDDKKANNGTCTECSENYVRVDPGVCVPSVHNCTE
jgi:hypothetical protein